MVCAYAPRHGDRLFRSLWGRVGFQFSESGGQKHSLFHLMYPSRECPYVVGMAQVACRLGVSGGGSSIVDRVSSEFGVGLIMID